MATQIINGQIVTRKDEGTKFGGDTMKDRLQNTDGSVKKDAMALTFGGMVGIDPSVEDITGASINVLEVTLNKTASTLKVGANETLTATVLPSNASNKTVTWTSSDTAIATVTSAGVVTGVKAGTAVITAKAGNATKTAAYTITT